MEQIDERPREYTGRNLATIGMILSIAGVALNVIFMFTWWTRMWL